MAEKGLPKIGIDMLHMANVLVDKAPEIATSTPGEYKHTPPERIQGLVSVGFTPEQSVDSFYADNGPYATAKGSMAIEPEFEMADVPLTVLGKYFGGKYEEGGYLPIGDIEPDIAVAYRVKKANGHYRYFKFFVGKANMPSMDAKTQADGVDWGPCPFHYTGEMRQLDSQPFAIVDDDDANLPAGVTPEYIAKAWFTDLNWMPKDGPVVLPTLYNVSVMSDNITEGTVTATPTGSQAAGTVITINAIPESGFTFAGWASDNGGAFADDTAATTTFTTPAKDVVITATFA